MPNKCCCCTKAFTGSTKCKKCSNPCCSTCRNEGHNYGVCCQCAGESCARTGGGGDSSGGGGGGGRAWTEEDEENFEFVLVC